MYFKGVNRGLNFTTLGWYLVIIVMVIGLLGITTGINGMFVFLGLTLGMFIVSGLISESNIRNSQVHISQKPQFLEPGENKVMTYKIENKGKSHSLYGLEVRFHLENPKSTKRRNVKSINLKSSYIHKVASLSIKQSQGIIEKISRGYFSSIYVDQRTSFPFGVFSKYKIEELKTKLYVIPNFRQDMVSDWQRTIKDLMDAREGLEDFTGHEEYRIDTPFNRILWKKNAGKDLNQWVAKKLISPTKYGKVCIKPISGLLETISKVDFEILLENIRTGLEVLEANHFEVSLDLGSFGRPENYDQILMKLATVEWGSGVNDEASELRNDSLVIQVSMDQVGL